jgi:hypothetical protein
MFDVRCSMFDVRWALVSYLLSLVSFLFSLASCLLSLVSCLFSLAQVSYRHPALNEDSPVDHQQPWLDEEFILLKSLCAQVSLMLHSRGSDFLLSTMLPKEIAQSLRDTGAVAAKEHVCT